MWEESAGGYLKDARTHSAAMSLDVYADLFDGDLDSVSDALDHAVSQSSVGKMWADAQSDQSKRPRIPHKQREAGPFNVAVTVGFEPTLAFTPNNISSVAPSAARTRHQLK